jgi:adapter protein MecA 1/2
MRLERIDYDKIKIFLTYDDLHERGIAKEELWEDLPRVHELFHEMMLEADDELGFKADGPIAVEVFSLAAQGMVIIVSKSAIDHEGFNDDEDCFEFKVTLDESDMIFFEFRSFEDIISVSSRLLLLNVTDGIILSMDDTFYLYVNPDTTNKKELEAIIATLSEFGSPSTVSPHRVLEYGSKLMEGACFQQIVTIFH